MAFPRYEYRVVGRLDEVATLLGTSTEEVCVAASRGRMIRGFRICRALANARPSSDDMCEEAVAALPEDTVARLARMVEDAERRWSMRRLRGGRH